MSFFSPVSKLRLLREIFRILLKMPRSRNQGDPPAIPQSVVAELFQEGLDKITSEIKNAAISVCNANLRPDFVFFGKPSESAIFYFRKLAAFKKNNNLSDADIFKFIPKTLKGNAEIWYQGLELARQLTWDIFQSDFLSKFLPKEQQREVTRQLMNCRQGYNETAQDFLYRVQALNLQLIVPMESDFMLDVTLRGLTVKFRTAVDPTIHNSMDILESRLLYLQGIFSEERSAVSSPTHSNVHKPLDPRAKQFHPVGSNISSNNFQRHRYFCEFCKRSGHTIDFCQKRKN